MYHIPMISIESPYSHKIQEFHDQKDDRSGVVPAKDLVEILLRTLNALCLREHLSVDKDLTKIEEFSIFAHALLEIFKKSPLSELACSRF
jgi:hypothetical protein